MTDDFHVDSGPQANVLSHERATLVKLLVESKSRLSKEIEPATRLASAGKRLLPASWAQGRLWFIDRLDKGSAAYHLWSSLRLQGVLRRDALQSAFASLVERHEALRTRFLTLDGEVMQEISLGGSLDLKIDDLRLLKPEERRTRARALVRAEVNGAFDLETGPVVRVALIRLSEFEHVLQITMHHIVSDGWSLGIIERELSELYNSFLEGRAPELPPLPFQYGDYVQWERQWLHGGRLERQLSYWQCRLATAATLLELPTDRPRPLEQRYRGASIPIEIVGDLTAKLKLFAERFGISFFMTLLGSFAILLSRICGADDIIIGTPVANRQHSGAEGVVGCFVNMLPLRIRVSGEWRLEEFFGQVAEVALGAYENQMLPFEKMVEAVQPRRDLSHHPLCQVVMAFQNVPGSELALNGLEVSADDIEEETAKFDLLLSVEEKAGTIQGEVNYASGLFDRETVRRWMDCFEVLLDQVVEIDASKKVADLRMLSTAERQRVIEGFNPVRKHPQDHLLQELIEEQVSRTVDAVAVAYEEQSLTYGELNARANQLAWYLRERGVGAERLVGICMERSLEMVVGLLAVLKAGGAYVPLDPSYPVERLAYMLEDAVPSVVLTQERLKGRLGGTAAQVVAVDTEWEEISRQSTDNPEPRLLGFASDQLAYMIYTSGSTGRPKGAMNEHRAVVNRLLWMQEQYRLDGRDRVLQKTPFSFDVSVWEFFWPLMSGARLIVACPEGHKDPGYLMGLIEACSVTTLHFVPSMLQAFLEQHVVGRCASVRHIVCSGEELTPALQNRCLQKLPQVRLSNLYGPTECAVDVTAWECVLDEAVSRVPIGRPVANTKIYILDREQEPLPVGVAGEIYIGGVQVGRGYWNRPELTAERFVRDPFSDDPKARMYKTGDLGRWRADGTIEYLGRNDHQVKIRGFRIELGEIEAQLARHPEIKEAVVLAREDEPGEKRLVGYVIARDKATAPDGEALREHLKGVLPDYMVPSAFVMLESFPLTPNGKLDRRALPAPDLTAYTSRQYEAPQGEVEEILAGIWQELLRVQRVGRNDNFFELGGHSLLIVHMLERLRRVGLSAEVRRVFESPTLSDLAGSLMRGAEAIEVPPNLIPQGCERITPQMLPLVELEQTHIDRIVEAVPGGAANVQDIYPLAPLQEGILFHHLLKGPAHDAYVRPMLFAASLRQDVDDLLAALQAVVNRHDTLRTAVTWEHLPKPVQVVLRNAKVPVNEIILDPENDLPRQLKQLMDPAQLRLDLRSSPLVRVKVAARPDDDHWYVLVCTHHFVCDNQSITILLEEIAAHLEGRAGELPEAIPYRNHVSQALGYARSYDAQAFFRSKLAEITEPTAPFEVRDVHGVDTHIEKACAELNGALAKRIRTQARRLGVSAAALFHASWSLVVSRTSGRVDVVFGTVLLGRLQSSAGAQRILGMFINTLPLRIPLQGLKAEALVQRTQQELLELLGREQASLAEAQRCSGIGGSAALFTSLLNYRHGKAGAEAAFKIRGVDLIATTGRTNYPILLSIDDQGDDFVLEIEADQRIDAPRMLDYMLTATASLLEALEHEPDRPALALEVLREGERRAVVEVFNATEARYPKDQLLQELIEEQVSRTVDAVAVAYEEQSLTYGELNARANQLAWYLRERGVGAERLVGICMERSLEMVVGLLAVLKAGGAYVPLDPSYPVERLAYMLEDAVPSVVLTQERLKGRLGGTAAQVVAVDTEWEEISRQSTDNPEPRLLGFASDQLAYMIYTSGSTGRPKGAMNEHRAVVNRLLWMQEQYRLDGRDRVLQKTPFSFDVSVWEFFWPLMSGARLIVACPEGHKDPGYLMGLIEACSVTTLHFVPSMLQAFLEQHVVGRCASVRHIVCSGEELTPALQNRCLQKLPQVRLSNLYGPTECAVDVTAWECVLDEAVSRVPIGRPVANTKIYILDREQEPLPVGVAGEIYIGGVQVGRGYWNRPELTAERFVRDPFSDDPKARMYKTGDLGRWRADGTIEYLGRNDHQVKIRGFRIELGEIEAQLARHPEIKEAVVLAREDEPGEKRLVGYVIARDKATAPDGEALREHLKGVLPDYMVPSAFVMLESFPLTPNGKLDRRALPAPDLTAYTSRQYEAPQGEVEEILAGIWQELLRVQRVGRNDNFFELGGHSLIGVQLIGAVKDRFAAQLPVTTIFQYPTLRQIATTIELICKLNMEDRVERDAELEEGALELSSGNFEPMTLNSTVTAGPASG